MSSIKLTSRNCKDLAGTDVINRTALENHCDQFAKEFFGVITMPAFICAAMFGRLAGQIYWRVKGAAHAKRVHAECKTKYPLDDDAYEKCFMCNAAKLPNDAVSASNRPPPAYMSGNNKDDTCHDIDLISQDFWKDKHRTGTYVFTNIRVNNGSYTNNCNDKDCKWKYIKDGGDNSTLTETEIEALGEITKQHLKSYLNASKYGKYMDLCVRDLEAINTMDTNELNSLVKSLKSKLIHDNLPEVVGDFTKKVLLLAFGNIKDKMECENIPVNIRIALVNVIVGMMPSLQHNLRANFQYCNVSTTFINTINNIQSTTLGDEIISSVNNPKGGKAKKHQSKKMKWILTDKTVVIHTKTNKNRPVEKALYKNITTGELRIKKMVADPKRPGHKHATYVKVTGNSKSVVGKAKSRTVSRKSIRSTQKQKRK